MASVKTVWPTDPPYLQAAFSVLGLSEIEGSKHEKKVLEMYAASGHPEIHDDETPWCAAYIGWSLEHGGLRGTHSLMAGSYSSYGKPIDRTKTIPRGAIAVWTRVGGGHVNFVLADDGTYVTCIGGNQSNGKGGGVTISRRLKVEAVAYRLPTQSVAAPTADPMDMDTAATVPEPAPATTTVVTARTAAGTGAAVLAGGQVIASAVGGASDLAEKTTTVIDQSNQVIAASKQLVAVPKPGFWYGVLHFVTSPEFVVSGVVLIAVAWMVVWFIQKQHKPPEG